MIFATPVDALRLQLYTGGSLPGDVLAACGMRNGWPGGGEAEGSVLMELTRIARRLSGRCHLMWISGWRRP